MSTAFLSALHADPWNETLVDLEGLNRDASFQIEKRIAEINRVARQCPQDLRSSSLVVLGPPGTGKTHLFSRLRKHLGPRAVFVHLRPLLHAGLSPSFVLREAVIQLGQASYKRLQADALVGSLIGHFEGQSADFPGTFLSAFGELSPEERKPRLEAFVDQMLDIFPDLDETFADRILQLPFCESRKRRALLAWMAGEDCDPAQLSRIGAASSMNPENTVRALRTLGSIAALGAPLVLVFDQLENLIQRDTVEERVTQYGNLIAELVDSTRGLLVVQMALDSEWQQGIEPRLNLSQRSRVVMSKVAMDLPTAEQRRDLVKLWHDKLEEPEQDYPWPLSKEQLHQLTAMPGVTPRMLLSAFKEAHEGMEPALLAKQSRETAPSGETNVVLPEDMKSVLEEEWHTRLVAAHHHIDQSENRRGSIDPRRLCDALLQAAEFTDGLALRTGKNPYIQVEPRGDAGPWVCYLEHSHPRSIGAALDRALGKDSTEPGMILREQWRSFLPSWKSVIEKQLELIARPHVVWYELAREEAASLLALEEMLQLARSRDICDSRGFPVEEQEVVAFLREEVRPSKWAVLERLGGVGNDSPDSKSASELASEADFSAASLGLTQAENVVREGGSGSTIVAVLRRLRVASVDRVIRESHRTDSSLGRTQVVEGLESLGNEVRWFGRNIVAWGADS